MELYLYGTPSEDMLATKWVLQHKGYNVLSTADLMAPDYKHNHGQKPDAQTFAKSQGYQMLYADLVVYTDELSAAEVTHLVHAARRSGFAVAPCEELPAQAPLISGVENLVERLNIVWPAAEVPAPSLNARFREALERLCDRLIPARAPRNYRLNTKPLTTA